MTIASVVLPYAFAVFALAIALTSVFGPWLAFSLKAIELYAKKPFIGLIGRQAARMNLWFGGLFAVLVLSSLFQGFSCAPSLKGLSEPPPLPGIEKRWFPASRQRYNPPRRHQ